MSFLSPFVLLGLLVLPLIVWILRAMPPRPGRQVFGGMFFLERLSTPKQKPVRTPPVILILRVLAFACLIVGLAGPRIGPEPGRTEGPMTLILGNGWDAAQRWEERLDAARSAIGRTGGRVRILTTTDGVLSPPYSPEAAADALEELKPAPGLARWDRVTAALPEAPGRLVLIAGGAAPSDPSLFAELRGLSASLPSGATFALGQPRISGDAIAATLFRSDGEGFAEQTVRALSRDGRTISSETAAFDAGQTEAEISFRLPLALRNEVARLSVDSLRSAGTVSLLGSSAKRTLVGLVSTGAETLREGGFYIERALGPSAEVVKGTILELLALEPGMVILDDVGSLRPEERRALETFVSGGGILLRFSGPSLIAADLPAGDPLLPGALLGGERALGGALTWAEPQTVSSIDRDSPLAGLSVREEITVRRQVLSEPGSGGDIWASLADGTPLVTARRVEEGLVVLVHVSATPTWSDLPISGFFAQMMQRMAGLAGSDFNAEAAEAGEPLPPIAHLTGRGTLVDPPADAKPLVPGEPAPVPGLYGEGADEVAVNAFAGTEPLRGFEPSMLPRGARLMTETPSERLDLSAWFLAAALLLLAADAVLSMGTGIGRARMATAALALALAPQLTEPAAAQLRPPLPDQAVKAALDLRFAYIETGDAALDRISEAGLAGLSREATRRSSLEPAAPVGVDPDRDELSVYNLIYWPIRPGQTPPSDSALQRLEAFMDGGGMLIIDTADDGTPGRSNVLPDILGRLDAPPLERLNEENVLLFSFYKLDDLYGRNAGGQVWVETAGALNQRRDGVPSLIISGRDWASAWALDENGVPLRPAGAGGEARREYAFRAGINMAMVAITGNYKADQAEVTDMLEELGKDDSEY